MRGWSIEVTRMRLKYDSGRAYLPAEALGLYCRSNEWGVNADSVILLASMRAVLQIIQCGLNTMIVEQDMDLRPLVLFFLFLSLCHTCSLSILHSFVHED